MVVSLMLIASVVLAGPGYARERQGCGVTFIGLHGLNEGTESRTVHDVWDRFMADMDGRGVPHAAVFLNHETLSSTQFVTQLATGNFPISAARRLLDQTVGHVIEECATEKIVLLGYSEGAWIANAWVRAADAGVVDSVAGIVFLGDPQWLRGNEYGIARRFGLVFAALELNPYIPPHLADRTWSYCVQDDPICGIGFEGAHSVDEQRNAALQAERTLPRCGPHCDYVPSLTTRAAENLVSVSPQGVG